MHHAFSCRGLKNDTQVGVPLAYAHLNERPAVGGVGCFDGEVVHNGVAIGDLNGVQKQGPVRCVEHGAGSRHGADPLGQQKAGAEGATDVAPQGQVLTPCVRVGGQGVKLDPRPNGVPFAGKFVLDVKVAVAVVAVGADKHHAFVRQVVDEEVAQGGAVWRTPLWQPPAVVDDQALAVCLCHAMHPLKRIECCGLVDQQGGEEQFRRRRHACQANARTPSACNARHVRAMRGIAVDVGRVAAEGFDDLRRVGLRAIPVAGRGRPRLAVLVPHRPNARGGHGGVVKHGVGVVEAPVQDPHQHAFAMERRRKVESGMNAVHPCAVTGLVQVGRGTRGQFNHCKRRVVQVVQLVGIHAKGGDACAAGARDECIGCIRPSPPRRLGHALSQAPDEPHRGAAVGPGHRVSPCGVDQGLGVWESMREFLDFVQALAVGCGHGLAPNPSRCQQEEGCNQS